MTWSELLFAHWSIEPNLVARLLPSGLSLDIHNDTAWVGVVPFFMSNVTLRGCPPIPVLSRFLELNVRTYVTFHGKPGVWFFSLDAASRTAVRLARATFNLPYMDADMTMKHDDDGTVHYRSRRTHRGERTAHFRACYRDAGRFVEAEPGSLEYWLTARYCLYSANRKGKLFRGEIDHPPWLLAPATYAEQVNTMCDGLSFSFDGNPHVMLAKPVDVRAWCVSSCN